MLKILSIILVAIVVIIVAIFIVSKIRAKLPLYSDNYYTKIQAGGEIEEQYLHMGSYENIEVKKISVQEDFKNYYVVYPAQMLNGTDKYPIVIYSNGTGMGASRYLAQLKRLASWGFIVMGTDEQNSWSGFSSEMCLRLAIRLNKNETPFDWESNPYTGHFDLERIGVVGGSQGGVGAINAATDNKHSDMIKTIVALSPANLTLVSQHLDWEYDPSLIQIPTLLMSSTGKIDEELIISGEQLTEIYNKIPNNVPKLKMRKPNFDHMDMQIQADGYVTAWFMWQLQDDSTAAKAFTGDNPEIYNNKKYQDIKTNLQ
ncbi:MAG: lipase [bacterium]|nr:lipase [bacterium]